MRSLNPAIIHDKLPLDLKELLLFKNLCQWIHVWVKKEKVATRPCQTPTKIKMGGDSFWHESMNILRQ